MHKNLQKNTKNELIEKVINQEKEIMKLREKIKELEGRLNLNSTNSF